MFDITSLTPHFSAFMLQLLSQDNGEALQKKLTQEYEKTSKERIEQLEADASYFRNLYQKVIR